MKFFNTNEYGINFIEEEDLNDARAVLSSRAFFSYGPEAHYCADVEKLISLYMDDSQSLLVSNGTVGLRAVLIALGVKVGDFVAVNAFTFVASASAVYSIGAIPIPVDFDPITNISLDHLNAVLSKKPVAVIAVHWPGVCFDLKRVNELCLEHNISLIEDACQAFAAKTSDGVKAGTQGHVAVFSFQHNKLVSCGEGGCIVTKDRDLMERIRQYIDHGISRTSSKIPKPDWLIKRPGENFRLTEIQAAILYGQIKKLSALTDNLLEGKSMLDQKLKGAKIKKWDALKVGDIGQGAFFLFSDKISAKDAENYAASKQILLKPIWSKPYYNFYENYILPEIDSCVVAESVAARVRIVPTPPYMNEKIASDITKVMGELNENLVEDL